MTLTSLNSKDMAPDPANAKTLEVITTAVAATNDSSIVSKRSVEKFYVPSRKDHLLRHFVPKFQRRSPLINRGYWLRMRLIREAVNQFLKTNGTTNKHVINLGCGFDPLPFHYLKDYPRVKFIDIDYSESIHRKCEIISSTPELYELLSDPVYNASSTPVILSSANYLAVGIDLRDLDQLNGFIQAQCHKNDELLFISEVAITYMPLKDADALIEWASKFENGRFVLVEQILPAGDRHPFASTMLSHFSKINSPLKNIGKYPTLPSQVQRFRSAGWTSINACDFYGAWCNLISEKEKSFVESVEAFDDEWSCGYRYQFPWGDNQEGSASLDSPTFCPVGAILTYHGTNESEFAIGRRKFGAAAVLSPTNTVYNGGMDNKTRSSFTLVLNHANKKTFQHGKAAGPSARVFHTLTTLEDDNAILIGGRGNPNEVFSDCWIYSDSSWRRVHDLPSGRYRHCAVLIFIHGECHVLVFGGRGNGGIVYDSWLLWSRDFGWRELPVFALIAPEARFSASLACFNSRTEGVLSGGLRSNGEIISDMWSWSLDQGNLQLCQWSSPKRPTYALHRAGAQIVTISDTKVLLCGGVTGRNCSPSDYSQSFFLIDSSNQGIQTLKPSLCNSNGGKPLILVGFSAIWRNKLLEILGGGIIAFSMGAFWNQGLGSLRLGDHPDSTGEDKPYLNSPSNISQVDLNKMINHPGNVEKYNITSHPLNIQAAIERNVPLIFEGLSFGRCISCWAPEYLKSAVGDSKEVTIHKAKIESVESNQGFSSIHLNFNAKNFTYERCPFSQLIDTIFDETPKELCYLRSVSSKPTKYPSMLGRDFPEIAQDFEIPDALSFIDKSLHSSPLRISSPGVGIWLHYDVCANFLFQILGKKRILLFPPSDVHRLDFPPGKTTSSIENIFENIPRGTNPKELIMSPGDILYIPPFWLHAVFPLEPCIAVNTFFYSFNNAFYSQGKDLYGNKDLKCYQEGRDMISDILQRFSGLESNIRQFYITRLGHELLEYAANLAEQ
ncbi:tRNA methyltransferase ppm2 [Orbilia ellipsospora]|uniref:tRNA wybutosine-synthesizing protein 4 n=1 Tax=Orbilia ellipsospora TaxID=2528407 RepID=A0AAV9XDP0_9PEZI